jgi:hypothetical protein
MINSKSSRGHIIFIVLENHSIYSNKIKNKQLSNM